MESGWEVDTIATDFSKAFDKISHNIILFKLEKLGFPTNFQVWVASYLKERRYRVAFRNARSEPFLAPSGVPQGSHLGPLLFILTINDINAIIKHSYIALYADDAKIFKIITSPTDSSDLQVDLENFSTWCHQNHLELNLNKCQTITYTRKRSPTERVYYLNNIKINRVSTMRDLGVICDSKLSFLPHYNHIVSKANSALGFIKRWSREFSDPFVTKSLYMAITRPILEYGSHIWCPYQAIHIGRIESVQKRFVRFALRGLGWTDPLRLPPYLDRLRLIDMRSLEERRRVADVVFLQQTLAGNIDCPALLREINLNTNVRSLRSVPMFKTTTHRTDYAQNGPFNRMLRSANMYSGLVDFHLEKGPLKKVLYSSVPSSS